MDGLKPGDILETNNLLRLLIDAVNRLAGEIQVLNTQLSEEDREIHDIPSNGWIPALTKDGEDLIAAKHYWLKVRQVSDKSKGAEDVDGTWFGDFQLTNDVGQEIHSIHQTDNFATMEEAKDALLDAAIEWFGDFDNIADELREVRERREE